VVRSRSDRCHQFAQALLGCDGRCCLLLHLAFEFGLVLTLQFILEFSFAESRGRDAPNHPSQRTAHGRAYNGSGDASHVPKNGCGAAHESANTTGNTSKASEKLLPLELALQLALKLALELPFILLLKLLLAEKAANASGNGTEKFFTLQLALELPLELPFEFFLQFPL
jgi:hypothetical protein